MLSVWRGLPEGEGPDVPGPAAGPCAGCACSPGHGPRCGYGPLAWGPVPSPGPRALRSALLPSCGVARLCPAQEGELPEA